MSAEYDHHPPSLLKIALIGVAVIGISTWNNNAAKKHRTPAVQKANDALQQKLSIPEQVAFADAKTVNAGIDCQDHITGEFTKHVVLPSGGPERDRIMRSLNSGICRVSLKP